MLWFSCTFINKISSSICVKTLGFLQLTAKLLIGAEARRVHCPSCAQPPLLARACEPLLSSVRRRAPRRGSLGPVPSTHRQKPSSPLPLSQQALARPPRPPSLSSRPNGTREPNRRWAEHWSSVKQKGAKACFMVPRWSASAHVCREKCDRASTDDWSPTKASGFTRTSARCGIIS
jgi:hypothetical protein